MTRVLMVLVMLAGVAHADEPYDAKRAFAAKFDEKSLATIRGAKFVELIRLQNDAREERMTAASDGGAESFGEYAIARRFEIHDSNFVARFKTLVLNPDAYHWYRGFKMCGGFQPKVVLRFGADALHSVDVFLCFNCDDIAVRLYGKTSIGEGRVDKVFSDMGTDDWLRLVQSALPNDEFIQKQLMHGEVRQLPPAELELEHQYE